MMKHKWLAAIFLSTLSMAAFAEEISEEVISVADTQVQQETSEVVILAIDTQVEQEMREEVIPIADIQVEQETNEAVILAVDTQEEISEEVISVADAQVQQETSEEAVLATETQVQQDAYQGKINLKFDHENGVIHAQLETDDLLLVSLNADQVEDYAALFSDPRAVEKYTDGQPLSGAVIEQLVQGWIARWENQEDPFSAFAIFEKQEGNPFVGHIVIGHGSRYAQSELAILLRPEFNRVGYATQAISAVLYGYIPMLARDQYLANLNNSAVDPSPLRSIHATARFDDALLCEAMSLAGMKSGESDVIWGSERFHYLIRVDEILNCVSPIGDSPYFTCD